MEPETSRSSDYCMRGRQLRFVRSKPTDCSLRRIQYHLCLDRLRGVIISLQRATQAAVTLKHIGATYCIVGDKQTYLHRMDLCKRPYNIHWYSMCRPSCCYNRWNPRGTSHSAHSTDNTHCLTDNLCIHSNRRRDIASRSPYDNRS